MPPSSSLPEAWLLGDPERLPFPGHLRLLVQARGNGVAVAGRVGVGDDLAVAYTAARILEKELSAGLRGVMGDRHALLHQVWDVVADLSPDLLGPAAGQDLTLLAVAADADGISVAGVGLSGVWGRAPTGLTPLVSPGHPLLGPAGRPQDTPGVLTLDHRVFDVIVGAPAHLEAELPPSAQLARRCGVRS